jgi:3' terminal RNA ribose 2'-O-methyltransferase Hen1
LLHKHPDKLQSFDQSFGRAHVFYPEASDGRCTAALMLEIDPVGLARRRGGPAGEGFVLRQYVNDRPYVASSFLSTAISDVFGTALAGRCKTRPDLVDQPLSLTAVLSAVPIRGIGEETTRSLFESLGYSVSITRPALDERFPDWGEAPVVRLELSAAVRLQDLLSHLYVLIPVLDNDKHYWVGEDEIAKLMRHGQRWLPGHPLRELIVRRYLKHQPRLARLALERLLEEESPSMAEDSLDTTNVAAPSAVPIETLNEQRLTAVTNELVRSGATSVLDLGCAQGNLLRRLLAEKQFARIVGYDVSIAALDIAEERLRFDRLPEAKRKRIELMHGSLVYRDRRLAGFEAAAVVEVIEHLDPPRLAAFERNLFGFAKPQTVVLTTPNIEHNVRFEGMEPGRLRHRDHRFEWTRDEFARWANRVALDHGYSLRIEPVGPVDAEVGPPTQMGVFSR